MHAVTAFRGVNPWVRYLEGIGHGFVVLDVTPERTQAHFWFIRSNGDKAWVSTPAWTRMPPSGSRRRSSR